MDKKDHNEPQEDSNQDHLNDSITGEFPLDAEVDKDPLNTSGGSGPLDKRQRTASPRSDNQRETNRTPSPNRIPPNLMVAASPPKFVSMEEIRKAAEGVSNMALAHEIAVDDTFQLQTLEPPENSIEKQVKEVMHKAFWDLLNEKLNEDPPEFDHALVLLSEVKQGLYGLLLPQHKKLGAHIDEVLDMDLIAQKAEHGALDVRYYADFVISFMAKMCAPARDDEVAALKDIQDVVAMFKEIFKMLDVLKLDMANFTIQQMRPHIQQQSVDYERKKFKEFVKKQEENNLDGLLYTKAWLTRSVEKMEKSLSQGHTVSERDTASQTSVPSVSAASSTSSTSSLSDSKPKLSPLAIMNKAYLELLQWDDKSAFPETLLMDQARFWILQEKTTRLIQISAILLVTYGTVGGPIAGLSALKEKLKRDVFVILKEVPNSEVKGAMKGVAEHVNKEVTAAMLEHGFPEPDQAKQDLLKGQVEAVVDAEHPVYKVIKNRVFGFVEHLMTLSPSQTQSQKIPPGLSAMSEELSYVCGQFMRLVSYNRTVFGPFYADIINSLLHRHDLVGDEKPK